MKTNRIAMCSMMGDTCGSNHLSIARNEGRIIMNNSFGLARLGYDVNIFHQNFVESKIDCHESNGSIQFSKQPIYDEYDFSVGWGWQHINTINAKKFICIVNYANDAIDCYENMKDLDVTIVMPYKNLIAYTSKESGGIDIKFLPPLHPISCYHPEFRDYNYNPGKDKNGFLKIFVYVSSWEENQYGIREHAVILEQIKKIVSNEYKIKLYIQIHSDNEKKHIGRIIKQGDEIKYIYKCKYNVFLDMISKMDLFLIRGSQYLASGGIYDIISLGKPMLYISESIKEGIFRNPFYENIDELILMGESSKIINSKVDEFMNNPERKYNVFRENMRDSHFGIWKKWVENIFIN